MAFFDDPPPPPATPEPPPRRRPAWRGPPGNVLPGGFALRAVLERTERLAVWVDGGAAYPAGAVLAVNLRFHEPYRQERHRAQFGVDDLATGPRLGVLLADGARAEARWLGAPGGEPADGCRLVPLGGAGGDHSYRHELWLWPLPPPGTLSFFFRWSAEQVPERRTDVDASIVRDAVRDAVELWPDDRPPPGDVTMYAVPP